ncbi:MAG: c-type cytochrome [Candidatus Hydrogenedentes bacterium]|nr:c-type cytochrome [Candidatus Hydrogenedentota bacterium]
MRAYTLYLAVLLAVILSGNCFAQGYPPEEAPGKMTVPPGFSVKLVASEPVITQPVAMEFDDRGRLWVVQYMQYPNPEGLKRVNVDRYSRTTYDRIPEPPPHGPKGSDAITILEDTDGDSRADTHKNFVEGLNLCSGLAFGYGGVFVLQVPYLLFYPDRDRDDVPDSDPEVLLTGFGMEDAHSVANSLAWGPDGWLYGNQGSTVTAHIRGIEFQQGVWRYHPVTKDFELFCEGGGNMWGLDFDATGQEFSSTNLGPYVMLHGQQGGYYWKAFGKHGVLHNPYAFGYFEHVTPHDAQGGHVAVGGQVYQGGAYPAEFAGKYIVLNLLTHNIYWHRIAPRGSTFETWLEGEFLNSNDTWFAPSDMTTGPDGCLYVADWCDKRTAHPDPDAEWDRSNGRVYKIDYEGVEPPAPFDLRTKSSAELVDLLAHPNVWFRRHARVLLAERRDPAMLPRLREQVTARGAIQVSSLKQKMYQPELQSSFEIVESKTQLARESLWTLYAAGGFDERLARELLTHPDPVLRYWTVRYLGDAKAVSPKLGKLLSRLAKEENDVHVRAQLAASARRLPVADMMKIVATLALRAEDAADPHLPLLLWWAVEAHAMEDTVRVLDTFNTVAMWEAPIPRETLLPRLIRRYAADGSNEGDLACTRLLEGAPDAAARQILLAGLEQGLQERGQAQPTVALGNLFETFAVEQQAQPQERPAAPVSEELVNTVNRCYAEQPDDPVLLRLATRLDNDAAYARAKELAQQSSLPLADRLAVIAILGRFGQADSQDILFDIFAKDGNAEVRQAALDALRHFSEDAVGRRLLETYAKVNTDAKSHLRDVLVSKPNWTRLFLDAVDRGAIDTREVPLTQLRGIAHHNEPALDALVEEHWGSVKSGTPEEKLAEMRRMNNELNAGPGDPARGKKVYEENCMKCHQLFGEGAAVGPDLTQSNRLDREYLLVSLVDPSFMVRKEYQQYIVETKDGGLYNGVTAPSTPGTTTIINANAEPTVIPNDQIEKMRETDVSLMPEDLLTPLPGDKIRDFFAYLQQDAPK